MSYHTAAAAPARERAGHSGLCVAIIGDATAVASSRHIGEAEATHAARLALLSAYDLSLGIDAPLVYRAAVSRDAGPHQAVDVRDAYAAAACRSHEHLADEVLGATPNPTGRSCRRGAPYPWRLDDHPDARVAMLASTPSTRRPFRTEPRVLDDRQLAVLNTFLASRRRPALESFAVLVDHVNRLLEEQKAADVHVVANLVHTLLFHPDERAAILVLEQRGLLSWSSRLVLCARARREAIRDGLLWSPLLDALDVVMGGIDVVTECVERLMAYLASLADEQAVDELLAFRGPSVSEAIAHSAPRLTPDQMKVLSDRPIAWALAESPFRTTEERRSYVEHILERVGAIVSEELRRAGPEDTDDIIARIDVDLGAIQTVVEARAETLSMSLVLRLARTVAATRRADDSEVRRAPDELLEVLGAWLEAQPRETYRGVPRRALTPFMTARSHRARLSAQRVVGAAG